MKNPEVRDVQSETAPACSFMLVDTQGSGMNVRSFTNLTIQDGDLFSGMRVKNTNRILLTFCVYCLGVLTRYKPEGSLDMTLTLSQRSPYCFLNHWTALPQYSEFLNMAALSVADVDNLSSTCQQLADGLARLDGGAEVPLYMIYLQHEPHIYIHCRRCGSKALF